MITPVLTPAQLPIDNLDQPHSYSYYYDVYSNQDASITFSGDVGSFTSAYDFELRNKV